MLVERARAQTNVMFQCDSYYQCCACTAAVLKCYGLVVQPPPPPLPSGGIAQPNTEALCQPPPPLGHFVTSCVTS